MSLSETTRSALIAAALGAACAPLLAAVVLPAGAEQSAGAVSIGNFVFTPKNLTVKAGTTITWTNRDDIPHGLAWTNNAFPRSKPMDTDDSASITFTTPGIYQYFCYLHPNMVGTVVVEAATGSSTN